MAQQKLPGRLRTVFVKTGENALVQAVLLSRRNQGRRRKGGNRSGDGQRPLPGYHLLAAYTVRPEKGPGRFAVQHTALGPGKGLRPQQRAVAQQGHYLRLCRSAVVRAGQPFPFPDGIKAEAHSLFFFRLPGGDLRCLCRGNGPVQPQVNAAAVFLRQICKDKRRRPEQERQYKK